MTAGITLTFSRLGSACSSISEPAFYNHYGSIDAGVWFAVVLCIFSFLGTLILLYIDKKADL